MEIIEGVELARGPGERLVLLAHSQTELRRGLEFREPVVLRADDDEWHLARVLDIRFELDDTVYILEIGGRIPEDLAEERIAGLDPVRHDLDLHEIVDLLRELREQGGPEGDRLRGAQAAARDVLRSVRNSLHPTSSLHVASSSPRVAPRLTITTGDAGLRRAAHEPQA